MTRALILALLLSLTLSAIVRDACAIDTTGAPILDLPLSARVWAMGSNGAADNTEPANIFFNPANVVASNRLYFQGTRWSIAKDSVDDAWIGGLSAGFSHRIGGGMLLGLDLTYARLEFGEVELVPIYTTPIGPSPTPFVPTNETFTVTMGVGSTFGKDNEWRAGFAQKKFWQAYPVSLDTNSVTIARPEGYAFDFGTSVTFRTSWKQWQLSPALGVALVDLGSDIASDFTGTSYPLPTRFHFGGSLAMVGPRIVHVMRAQVPLLSVVANVDGTHRLHDQPFTWGAGAELSLAKVLFVRGGLTDDPGDASDLDTSAWGVGLGIPTESFQLRFDYTHTSSSFQPDIYGLSLSWQL